MTAPNDDPGERLPVFPEDRFQDAKYIGAGSNAIIYSARDQNLGRRVALKVGIQDGMLDNAGRQKLAALGLEQAFEALVDDTRLAQGRYTLLREAQLLAQIDHPNVIGVLDVGRLADGAIAVVMPLLTGGALDEQEPTERWQEVLELALQIGEGLLAIHDAGILHRDLKPNNVLIDRHGRPRITDLGLACGLEDDEDAMADRVGTGHYLSPEALGPRPRDQRDDLYAYCMVVFEMFYGHSPFASLEARIAGEVSDILRPGGMSKTVHEVLTKGLRPTADARWPDMRTVLVQLRTAGAESRGPQVRAPARWRWWAGAGAGVAATLVLGMFISIRPAEAGECEEVAEELAESWNDDIRSELRGAFGTRKAGDGIQDWVSRWVAVRARECEAGKQEGRSTRASPCSSRMRKRLETTVDMFRTPHLRKGLRVGTVIAELPAPEHCIEYPDDGEWAKGGLLELRTIEIELHSLVLMGDLDGGRLLQLDYLKRARAQRAEYDISRSIFWGAEISRLEGKLGEATKDFELVYGQAQALGVPAFGAEAMMKLTAIAGARGDMTAVRMRALPAREVFAVHEPSRIPDLLQVHGAALMSGPVSAREQGVGLLAEAVELRMKQVEEHRGTQEQLSQAHEDYARALLTVHRADEALAYLEMALKAHKAKWGRAGWRVHGLLRLEFLALVELARFEEAMHTEGAILRFDKDAENWLRFTEDAFWLADTYMNVGKPRHALWPLRTGRDKAVELGSVDDVARFDFAFAELSGE